MAEIEPWKQIIDEQGTRLVGISNVYLKKSDCNYGECNIGSLVTDAYVHAVIILGFNTLLKLICNEIPLLLLFTVGRQS